MQNIVLAIFDSEIPNLERLIESFTNEGMIIEYVFDYGVIIGSADPSTIERLRAYKEIESIELEKSIDLPPPDSEIQYIEYQ